MTDEQTIPTLDIPSEFVEQDAVAEALSVIDASLGQMMKRELVSAGEVADLLLDLRGVLTS